GADRLPGPRHGRAHRTPAPAHSLAGVLRRHAERHERAQSGVDDRGADARRLQNPFEHDCEGDRGTLQGSAAAGLDRPDSPAQLSTPAVRRDASAGDDRDGAPLHARSDRHGRADLRARRGWAAFADGADQRVAEAPRICGRLRHARHVARESLLRPAAGDVRRACGGVRQDSATLRSATPSVHARAARGIPFDPRPDGAPARHPGLVGESGSGKSTIARLLARVYKPTKGEIYFEGRPLSRLRSRKRRLAYSSDVPMVFQDPYSSINPAYRVVHGIARALRLHRGGLGRKGRRCEVERVLDAVGLVPAAAAARKFPYELSGGQRQRVGFAQALAFRPKLIIADEPVSMLDVSIRIGILNLMSELREREGVSFLYITHDVASARYIAD